MLSSLAVTDLIYSPYSLLRNVTEMFANEFMCPVEMDPGITGYGIGIMCNIATLGTLAIISRDRHLAVREPHLYQIYMTKSRAIKMICAPWLLSIIMLILISLSYSLEAAFITTVFFYFICFFVFGCLPSSGLTLMMANSRKRLV